MIQLAHDLDAGRGEPDLLVRLAASGVGQHLARILATTTGKLTSPLCTRMKATDG